MAGIKGKSGRKSLFKEEMLRQAYKLGALGLTIPEIAEFWGVGHRTLDRWIAKNPELKYEIERGRKEADLTVIQALLEQAKQGNITAAIFWLKNRQPDKWRDVQHMKGEGFGKTEIIIMRPEKNENRISTDTQTGRVLGISNE